MIVIKISPEYSTGFEESELQGILPWRPSPALVPAGRLSKELDSRLRSPSRSSPEFSFFRTFAPFRLIKHLHIHIRRPRLLLVDLPSIVLPLLASGLGLCLDRACRAENLVEVAGHLGFLGLGQLESWWLARW